MIQRMIGAAAFAVAAALVSVAAQAQTVKIAYIDPLSGAVRQRRRAGAEQFQLRRRRASTQSGRLGKAEARGRRRSTTR